MARSPQFMKIRVHRENVDPLRWASDVQVISATGMRKMADKLRDEMRDAYRKSIHGTEYAIYSSGAYSLENFIVTSPKWSPLGVYEVGAKAGQVVGRQTVDEIFKYMDEGTGIYNNGAERWTFELPSGRASASENGFWTTQGQPAKKFITGPAERSLMGFQRESDIVFGPPLAAYFIKGGKY